MSDPIQVQRLRHEVLVTIEPESGLAKDIVWVCDEIEVLTATVERVTPCMKELQSDCLHYSAENERLRDELETVSHQHKRDLAEYNRVTQRIAELEGALENWQRLAWLCGQDWVFFGFDSKPAIITNDVFAPAADAYEISLDQVDELYEIAKDKGYDGLIDWIIAREGWKRWRGEALTKEQDDG